MRKKDLLREPVEDIEPTNDLKKLVKAMGSAGGFTAKKLSEGVEILEAMMRTECTRFLSFPAALMATGTRGVLRTLVEKKMVDAVVTTCGTADHDLARTWGEYYHGDFDMDDKMLHRLGINRLGNVLVPNESYGTAIERNMRPVLQELWDSGRRSLSTRELLWEFGRRLNDRKSFLFWCWKNKIPVFVPAIFDGAFGYQVWAFWQDHKDLEIDGFKDESELADLVFSAKRTGALIVGGGVSKHHTIWWNQFREGLDYAVYITSAPEWDGSLSGARMREGISWGKVREKARHITIEGDASVLLPLIVSTLVKRL